MSENKPKPKPTPGMLGSGKAFLAGVMLSGRQEQIRKELEKAVNPPKKDKK